MTFVFGQFLVSSIGSPLEPKVGSRLPNKSPKSKSHKKWFFNMQRSQSFAIALFFFRSFFEQWQWSRRWRPISKNFQIFDWLSDGGRLVASRKNWCYRYKKNFFHSYLSTYLESGKCVSGWAYPVTWRCEREHARLVASESGFNKHWERERE